LSFEVESVLMNHRARADAAEQAVPNQLSEHGLKVIAVLQTNQRLSAAELFKWCAISGSSHLTLVREYRRIRHHSMGDRLVPPGAVDRRINDARPSSEP
jgi:acyl-coenzyme A synthetase/AMP-(fatty) acid ligase